MCERTTVCKSWSTEYIKVQATETTDAECATVTVCDDNSYELVAPTQVSDRECAARTGL